jgi:hypothetical protein
MKEHVLCLMVISGETDSCNLVPEMFVSIPDMSVPAGSEPIPNVLSYFLLAATSEPLTDIDTGW